MQFSHCLTDCLSLDFYAIYLHCIVRLSNHAENAENAEEILELRPVLEFFVSVSSLYVMSI
jgi:hypothetical protein